MQQIVLKREFYRVFIPATVRYSDNAEPTACSLEHSKVEGIYENSVIFGSNYFRKFVTPEDRITDIVLYDPDALLTLDEIVFHYKKTESIAPQESEEPNESHQRTLLETQLLEDAQQSCQRFRENWDRYVNPKVETRPKLRNISEDSIEIFLNDSVPLFAFDIKSIIDNLIQIEGLRESSFPEYKKIYENIEKETDVKKRAMLARKLVMLLESKIPASVKFKPVHSLTPIINSKASGTTDMEMWKQQNNRMK